MNLVTKIAFFCEQYDMLPEDSTVIACVSGGTDSMCLLNVLMELRGRFGYELHAAHFNHRLRGDESDGDEEFVGNYCESLGIPFHSGAGDVYGESRTSGRGIEETARDMRYRFFARIAGELRNARIATAHNAGDNLETVLLRVARGTGLTGLCGIPPVRGNIIRPMLTVTRQEIEQYNITRAIPHREDSTNARDDYARNRLRHHVVPVLRELNSDIDGSVADMTELLRRDEEFLVKLADDFISANVRGGEVEASKLLNLPWPVASRVVRELRGGLTFAQVRDVLALAANPSPSASLSLPGGTVRREYDKLVFHERAIHSFEPFSLTVGEEREVRELGLRFRLDNAGICHQIYKSFTTFLFKNDVICGMITVRARETGDCIRLSANSGRKSLKKLFIERRIPRELRGSVPVVCDEAGPLAIPGIGCDVRVLPQPGDEVLKLNVEEIKEK